MKRQIIISTLTEDQDLEHGGCALASRYQSAGNSPGNPRELAKVWNLSHKQITENRNNNKKAACITPLSLSLIADDDAVNSSPSVFCGLPNEISARSVNEKFSGTGGRETCPVRNWQLAK